MGRPVCPAWVSDEGKAAWKSIIPMLDDMGILAKIDRIALIRYCELWGRWKKASLWVQEHGEVYQIKSDEGEVKSIQQFPQVSIIKSIGEQLSRLETQFGLTPVARAGMTVGGKGKEKEEKGKGRFFSAG